jgi:LDH2 family malate/lactate/ureidoglycolate dehydrogenase
VGYKGYALSLLVELLGATLVGDPAEVEDRSINGFTIVAVNAGVFAESASVRDAAAGVVAYIKSSRRRPGHPPVRVPGELEFEALADAGPATTVNVDAETWHQLIDLADSVGNAVPTAVPTA